MYGPRPKIAVNKMSLPGRMSSPAWAVNLRNRPAQDARRSKRFSPGTAAHDFVAKQLQLRSARTGAAHPLLDSFQAAWNDVLTSPARQPKDQEQDQDDNSKSQKC